MLISEVQQQSDQDFNSKVICWFNPLCEKILNRSITQAVSMVQVEKELFQVGKLSLLVHMSVSLASIKGLDKIYGKPAGQRKGKLSMNQTILLIDDDDSLLRVTEYNLSSNGFRVIPAKSGNQGLDLFYTHDPDLVVSDVTLGDINGLDLLKKIKKASPDTPVIIITAFGSIEMAVRAMQKGAFNFITKPFDRDTLILSCEKALELRGLRSRAKLLSHEVDRLTGTRGIVSASSAMKTLLDKASKAANSDATVLISGESGTGKEVLARLIHQNSPRKKGPMVAVNCAAIPATLIESELFGHVKGAFTGAVKDRQGFFMKADRGTLFLDEIGELAMDVQVKLLRAIQEREILQVGAEKARKVDIRIIAATNLDLQDRLRPPNQDNSHS